MQLFMGKKKKMKSIHNAKSQHYQENAKRSRCRALCCGSRLSVSSTTSCSEQIGLSDTEQTNNLSYMAHGMVQARLDHMINGENSHQTGFHRRQRRGAVLHETRNKPVSNTRSTTGDNRKYVVLVAMERDSYDPREDFRRSIMEVIRSNSLGEPKDLKGLLNCYISMNSREHRQAILEAFLDVFSATFVCKKDSFCP
ncbi:transcription repressor [Rhynchospora pubera]|uniref:Transcription repressor n=1 Tax=Rhynchospora pubera TaxID=906938 RepID=A0AAV8HJZ7_9POAL|nr:transcription repressor [Rhynchospora pubera]